MTMIKTTLATILKENKIEVLNSLLVDYSGINILNPLNNPLIKSLKDLSENYASLTGGLTTPIHSIYIHFIIKFLGIDFNGYDNNEELEVGEYNPERYSIYRDIKLISLTQKYYRNDIFQTIAFDLIRYSSYLNRFITDNGFAKRVLEKRLYNEGVTSTGTSRGYNSETPQVSGLTDETLDTLEFLSNASKDIDESTSNREGDYEKEELTTSYKEAKENFAIIYEEAILDYIFSIPYIVYDFYSMNNIPLNFVKERMFDYYKDLKNE